MPSNVIERVWKMGKLIQIDDLKGIVCQSEAEGHTFRISGMDADGSVLPFSGTVSAVFLRPDMTDVAIAGSMAGGVASVTLPDECYDVPGRFGLTVYVSEGDAKTAVYAAVGTIMRTNTGTVAPESTADVVDLINRLEAIIPTIPESMPGLMADIAPTYSASAVYPVGAYCYYNGDLHRCIVPITAAESWNSAHWETAVIGNDLKGLADDLEAETEERKAADWDIQQSVYETKSTTDAVIEDAVPMPLESLALAMAPQQNLNGYTKPWVGGAGKNLLPPFGTQWERGNTGSYNCRTATGAAPAYPFTYDTEGATAYANVPVCVIKCVPNTTYTLTPPDGLRALASEYAQLEDVSDTSKIIASWATGSTGTGAITRTTSSNANYLVVAFSNWAGSGQITVDSNTQIQLEIGSTATAYEPYSNICPISGWDTVKVERTGKNLAVLSNFGMDKTVSGITLSTDGSELTIKGTATGVVQSDSTKAASYDLMGMGPFPAGTYTVKATGFAWQNGSDRIVFNARYSDNTNVEDAYGKRIGGNSSSIITFTATKEFKCGFFLYIASGSTFDCNVQIQMEIGSEATAYEPYQGQTIIHNIAAAAGGTVYGGTLTVNRDGTGTLAITHATETWDGTVQIWKGSSINVYYRAISNGSVAGRTNSGWFTAEQLAQIELICNLAETVADTSDAYIHVSAYCGSAIVLQPRIFLPDCSTVEEAQAWLAAQNSAGHPLTWCYKLKEPQTYTLTTEQVTTLLGYNRITSDAEITGLAYYAVKAVEVDLSGKADKNNPVIYGSLSLGRNILSTVGFQSTALGSGCTASETASHAIGNNTIASGSASHAEGNETEASGSFSHAEGNKTIANHSSQHVFGEYNIPDDSADASYQIGNYIEIVGNGTSYERSNARTLDWLGNEKLAGSITLGMGTADEVTITPAQLKRLLALLT